MIKSYVDKCFPKKAITFLLITFKILRLFVIIIVYRCQRLRKRRMFDETSE